MIVGVGTDIVAVARLREMFAKHGERFLERVLHPLERAELPENPSLRDRFLARRWAAKEAFAKAYGTGIRGEVALNAIIVRHDALGRPCFEFASSLAASLAKQCAKSHLSLSDESDYAVAFVVIET